MDPEQTFIRVQERFSQMLTPRIRAALEYIYLVVAIALFCLLVVMHANYVQQPGCSSELSGVETLEAQLVQIKISSVGLRSQDVMNILEPLPSTGNLEVPNVNGDGLTFLATKFWLNWIVSGSRRSKLVLKSWKTDNEYCEPQAERVADCSSSNPVADEVEIKVDNEESQINLTISSRESFKAVVIQLCSKCYRHFSLFWGHAKHFFGRFGRLWAWFICVLLIVYTTSTRLVIYYQPLDSFIITCTYMLIDIPKWLHMFRLDRIDSFVVQLLEKRGKSFEPTYLYTVEKGYFLLPEGAKSRHNVHTVNISISAWHSCFGNRWQQLLINKFVGYETILMNTLLSSPGQGYLYNYQTKEFYDLSYAHEPPEGSARFGDILVTKCGVLMMSLFVFFTTTMSVSFTLRETQTRMLKFTVQLQHHARHRLPTFQLIFAHVIESLVFVPIMLGILFFLFEFYDDQLLAFMVLILVWLCELFTLISVRSPISMKFFPRFFLLYFLVFHIYLFSYAYGFSYLAFSATAAFMQHLILYFWNRFEVPALERFMQIRRSQLQQHPDIHITSSTILASTLHIRRLNMRNPGPVNGDLASGPGPRPVPDQARAPTGAEAPGLHGPLENNSPDRVGSPLQFPAAPHP